MAQWNIPFESLLTKVSDSHRKMYVDGSAGRDINVREDGSYPSTNLTCLWNQLCQHNDCIAFAMNIQQSYIP